MILALGSVLIGYALGIVVVTVTVVSYMCHLSKKQQKQGATESQPQLKPINVIKTKKALHTRRNLSVQALPQAAKFSTLLIKRRNRNKVVEQSK